MAGVQKDGGAGGGASSTPAPATSAGTQNLQVTPENVVELALTFRQNASALRPVLQQIDFELAIKKPWLGDPFSHWAMEEFNKYFVNGENSLVATMKSLHQQHIETFEALKKVAGQYGKTDELNKQLMNLQEQTP